MRVVALLVILMCISLSVVTRTFAQEASGDAILVPSFTPSPTQIEYTLPYPGLLPDNPLYFLKVFRDNVVGFLIKDPSKKAQFDLLQADKRFESGIMLLSEKPPKVDMAETIMSKGENYFEDAVAQTKRAKAQGVPVNDFLLKMRTADRKYKEILVNERTVIPSSQQQGFLLLQKRVESFDKTLSGLIQK